MKEEISQNNVLEMAELIAFMGVFRYVIWEVVRRKCMPTCMPILGIKMS